VKLKEKMSKTPEELAEKYVENYDEMDVDIAEEAFLAGYQAAKEHAHAALEEAEARHEAYVLATEENFKRLEAKLDQLADADKVMPQWISVKDRLPNVEKTSCSLRKESSCVLIVSNGNVHVAHLCEKWCDRTQLIFQACDCDCRAHDMEQDEWELDQVTHWQPLPTPPKEEK